MGKRAIFEIVSGWVVLVDIGVEYEEGICVLECTHKLTLALRYVVGTKARWKPWRGRRIEVPSYRIGTLNVKYRPWIYDVTLVLGHFDTVFVVDVS